MPRINPIGRQTIIPAGNVRMPVVHPRRTPASPDEEPPRAKAVGGIAVTMTTTSHKYLVQVRFERVMFERRTEITVKRLIGTKEEMKYPIASA